MKRFPIESRLFHKLSTRHRLAYVEAVSKLPSDSPEFPLWEYYYRCRLLQDYISGMTDLYAWDEYRRLMAVEHNRAFVKTNNKFLPFAETLVRNFAL